MTEMKNSRIQRMESFTFVYVSFFCFLVSSEYYSVTSVPFRVAELDSVIFTFTKSPIRWLPRSNTTTLFCSVRPNNCSLERLDTPSTNTSKVLPTFLHCFRPKLVLQFDEFVQTADFDFFRHVVGKMLGCVSARTFGILEHEGRIVGIPASARGTFDGLPPFRNGSRRRCRC